MAASPSTTTRAGAATSCSWAPIIDQSSPTVRPSRWVWARRRPTGPERLVSPIARFTGTPLVLSPARPPVPSSMTTFGDRCPGPSTGTPTTRHSSRSPAPDLAVNDWPATDPPPPAAAAPGWSPPGWSPPGWPPPTRPATASQVVTSPVVPSPVRQRRAGADPLRASRSRPSPVRVNGSSAGSWECRCSGLGTCPRRSSCSTAPGAGPATRPTGFPCTCRSGPVGRRCAHTHLLGLTGGEDWSMMGAQLQEVAAPALVVVDGEAAITVLAQRLWPAAPIQRCWWHLPHGLRKAFYADDAANRHVNPRWARTMAGELAERLREQIRGEHTTEQALADWDAFSARIPAALTSAHAYLDAARPHAFTCLDPDLRKALARLGGPELATGVIERRMRELNARTDIGGVRWTIAGLRDLLTVLTARALRHPAWTEIRRNTRPSNTIQFRLQKFNAT